MHAGSGTQAPTRDSEDFDWGATEVGFKLGGVADERHKGALRAY